MLYIYTDYRFKTEEAVYFSSSIFLVGFAVTAVANSLSQRLKKGAKLLLGHIVSRVWVIEWIISLHFSESTTGTTK